MSVAFVIDKRDNVATALEPCESGESITLVGESDLASIRTCDPIRPEHKIALREIFEGQAVIKYGMPIGRAVSDIQAGEWVHLHNCASNFDKRSSTLDGESGVPTDIEYA